MLQLKKLASLVGALFFLLATGAPIRAAGTPESPSNCDLHLWGVEARQIGGSMFIKVAPAATSDPRPNSLANATNPMRRLNAYRDEEFRGLVPFASAGQIVRHGGLVDRSYLKRPERSFGPVGVTCEMHLVLSDISYTIPPAQSKGLVADLILGGASMRSSFLLLSYQGGKLVFSYRDSVSAPVKYTPGSFDVDPTLAVQDMNSASLRNLTEFSKAAAKKVAKRS